MKLPDISIVKKLWIPTLILLLVSFIVHWYFVQWPVYTVDYWIKSLTRGKISSAIGNVVACSGIGLLILLWLFSTLKLWIRVGISVLIISFLLVACGISFIGGFQSSDLPAAEYYLDSAYLDEHLYHLVVTQGSSGERPSLRLHQCDSQGWKCNLREEIPVSVIQDELTLRDYPIQSTFLIVDQEKHTLYIRQGDDVIYQYQFTGNP